MVNFDEIEFLECEIVDDDPDAPVGTLIRASENGIVEELIPQEAETISAEPEQAEAAPIETSAEIASDELPAAEAVDEPIIESIEEPIEAIEQAPVAETISEQDSVEVIDQAPAAEIVAEPVQEPVNEAAEPLPEAAPKEEKKPAPKKKAPARKAVATPQEKSAPAQNEPKKLDLATGGSVNDALFDTSFEIEQPAKAKVVSTKKKQEKQEDLWAVAAVAKPQKSTPVKTEEEPKEEPKKSTTRKKAQPKSIEAAPTEPIAEKAPAAKKKSAPKKTTNVENITPDTEEKKVAKATDKKQNTPAPVVEEKPAKAPKAVKPADDTNETVLVEGEGKIHGKFVIKKTDKGNFVFKLYSSNHRVVAIGAQAYTTLGAAKIGVQSIINNAEKAPIENQTLKNYETLKFPKWEIYTDKKGEYRLRLFATNGNLIATTNDGYADISGAKNGIAAVARASKGCSIVRNDDLW